MTPHPQRDTGEGELSFGGQISLARQSAGAGFWSFYHWFFFFLLWALVTLGPAELGNVEAWVQGPQHTCCSCAALLTWQLAAGLVVTF